MGVVLSIGAALLIYPGGVCGKHPWEVMRAGDRGCAAAYPGETIRGGIRRRYTGRDPVHDGDPDAADVTEEEGHGEVVALAIRQKDGMGQGPQSKSTVLDLRTADRLLARAVKR